MNYTDITIEEAERVYDKLQCDVVCDADKQEIIFENIIEEFINNFIDGLLNAFNKVIQIVQAFNNIKEYIINIFNKKISKKKFIKLLQSYGLQRNDINELIKNNKDEYTMWRLLLNIPPSINS